MAGQPYKRHPFLLIFFFKLTLLLGLTLLSSIMDPGECLMTPDDGQEFTVTPENYQKLAALPLSSLQSIFGGIRDKKGISVSLMV